jgi:putative photosynthetic complex assembly protein
MQNLGPAASHRFPRAPLIGMWGLVGLALILAATARLMGTESSLPTSKPLVVKDLRFEDRTDGGVAVFRTGLREPIDVVSPGTNGFLRATLRGLARERKRQGIGQDQPFRLTGWSDGRVTLDDASTGRHIDLGVFGPTNAHAFTRLLVSKEATP